MLSYSKKILLLPFFILTIVFSGCTKIGNAVPQKGHPLSSPYTLPVDAYLSLANRQAGEEKSALIIMAAGRAIDDGHWQKAEDLLSSLSQLPTLLSAEKQILLAKIQSLKNHPLETIQLLSTAHDVHQLSLFYQVQYHENLAFAYDATGRLPEAIGERIILDKLLPTEAEQIRNRRILWLTLTNLPDAELNTMLAEWPDAPLLQGWLKIARIAKQSDQHDDLLSQIHDWQSHYPTHPAQSMLPDAVLNGKTPLYLKASHIALLLPTTGPLSGPGLAIYDGFMAAKEAQPQRDMTVHLYDTNAHPVKQLYKQAIGLGADFVIGPLSKPDVAQVLALDHPVPTIVLNDIEKAPDQNTYFLTLSPSNEAKQVATKARLAGYQHALIIAPQGRWGDEVMQAFEHQWQTQHGKVVDILRYDAQTPLNKAIRQFMLYTAPLSKETGVQAARREDFDMIFLLAYPSKAREIMSILRYYYLGQTPVYATSAVYAGHQDVKLDRDLDGIIFCDMPYVFTHDLPNKHWPEFLNSYSRLYALGMDAYALTKQLNALMLFPALGINDKSGVLYLNHDHQIVRLLAWGQFKQGEAKMISTPVQK